MKSGLWMLSGHLVFLVAKCGTLPSSWTPRRKSHACARVARRSCRIPDVSGRNRPCILVTAPIQVLEPLPRFDGPPTETHVGKISSSPTTPISSCAPANTAPAVTTINPARVAQPSTTVASSAALMAPPRASRGRRGFGNGGRIAGPLSTRGDDRSRAPCGLLETVTSFSSTPAARARLTRLA